MFPMPGSRAQNSAVHRGPAKGAAWSKGHLLVGPVIPNDWPAGPTDGVAISVTVPGNGAGGLMSAGTFVSTGTQRDILISGTMGAGVGANSHEGLTVFDVTMSSGSSVAENYGIHIAPIANGSSINQALWVEGSSNRVGIGTSIAQALVHINQNGAGNITSPVGAQVMFTGADNSSPISQIMGFGSGVPSISMSRTRGTGGGQTALQSSDFIFNLVPLGSNGTSYVQPGSISVIAVGGWSTTANGICMDFSVTPSGTTTFTRALRIQGSGGLSVTNTNDPGAGLIMQNSSQFVMRTATSWAAAGATSGTATLGGAPTSSNPSKWIPFDDNGTTRWVPTWTST